MSEQEEKKEAGEDKDDVIKHNQAELFAENVSLRAENAALMKKLSEVTTDLNDARHQLEAQACEYLIQLGFEHGFYSILHRCASPFRQLVYVLLFLFLTSTSPRKNGTI